MLELKGLLELVPVICFYPFPSLLFLKTTLWGFPGGAVVENLPANAVDTGSSPGLGGSHMPQSD